MKILKRFFLNTAPILCFILMSWQLGAQSEFRVISCSGHAKHISQSDSLEHLIVPGNKLEPNGTLVIDDNCSCLLYTSPSPRDS